MSKAQATFDEIADKAESEPDESESEPLAPDRPAGEPVSGFPRLVRDSEQLSKGHIVAINRPSCKPRKVARADGNIIETTADGTDLAIYGGGPAFTRRNDTREKELYLIGVAADYEPPESDRKPLLSGEPESERNRTGAYLD